MTKILIVEDEKDIARFMELELKYNGYEVTVANDGMHGLELALSEEYSLILLDLMLPEIDGMEICRRVREVKTTPIIMVTAKHSIEERVAGLDFGADDYLAKPFDMEELLARVRATLRRVETSPQQKDNALKCGNILMNLDAHEVMQDDKLVELTKTEFALLRLFLENVNRVQTRDDILKFVWGDTNFVEHQIIDVYIKHLRDKIGRETIQTVRGVGYIMKEQQLTQG
ncbi:MAG: response regulator transcription factor [Culicoidibacterales bacterium]